MATHTTDLTEWERRSLLKALGPVGVGGLAGCIGDDDEAPDDVIVGDTADIEDIDVPDDDDRVDAENLIDPRDYTIEGQTLRLPGSYNPEETYLAPHEWIHGHRVWPEEHSADYDVMDATNEWSVLGLWPQSAFWEDPGEFYPVIYEDVLVSEELLRLEIADDATWQDGEPITARDGLITISTYGYTPDAAADLYYGSQLRQAKTPDGLDGKVIELEVLPAWLEESDGWLHHQPGFLLNFYLGPYSRCGGVRNGAPSHIDPYDELFERMWEYETTKYEIMEEHPELWDDPEAMREHREQHEHDETLFDTWWRENMPEEDQSLSRGEGAVPRMTEILVKGEEGRQEGIMEMSEFIELTRDPDWYTGHGLYELDEIMGTEGYRLVVDEDHRFYDEHTFDEIFIEWTEEDHRERAAVMAEHLDYGDVTMSPEMTAELPDSVSQLTYPDGSGHAISLNHAYWPGDSPLVRQALMHATNRKHVADNIHPDTAAPIMTPGWDHWGAAEFIDEEWAENHLTTYEYNLDRAAELMEEAGYERIDGYWHDAAGNRIEDIIATSEEAPVFEETIADQWQEFGIDISVQAMDDATFTERWQGPRDPEEPGDGEYAVYSGPSNSLAGWFPNIGTHFWIGGMDTVRGRHWYGTEATEERLAAAARPDGYTIDFGWDLLTFEVPPAGQPESDERVPFAASWADIRATRDRFDFTGDNQPVQEGLYEPDRMNVDNLYEAHAWTINWLLVDLPMVRNSGQLFVNTENFLWGEQVPDIHGLHAPIDATHDLWEYFGVLGGPHYYAPTNMVWSNPEHPKDGAELRGT